MQGSGFRDKRSSDALIVCQLRALVQVQTMALRVSLPPVSCILTPSQSISQGSTSTVQITSLGSLSRVVAAWAMRRSGSPVGACSWI